MDQTASIQDRFGAAAARYATSAVHRGGPDLDAMLAAGVRSGRERVLDVGCGAGHTALAFAARTAEVVAYDLTPAMLEQARALAAERGLANLAFEQGHAARLPFPDASFDVVTSRFAAHHFDDPASMVREAARVLRPGGLLLLSDTIADEKPALDSFVNALEILRDASHVRNHRVSEWEALFRAAELEPSVLGRFPIALEFDAWIARIGTPPDAVTGLRALFATAPDEARAHFAIGADHAFRLDSAVLQGLR